MVKNNFELIKIDVKSDMVYKNQYLYTHKRNGKCENKIQWGQENQN